MSAHSDDSRSGRPPRQQERQQTSPNDGSYGEVSYEPHLDEQHGWQDPQSHGWQDPQYYDPNYQGQGYYQPGGQGSVGDAQYYEPGDPGQQYYQPDYYYPGSHAPVDQQYYGSGYQDPRYGDQGDQLPHHEAPHASAEQAGRFDDGYSNQYRAQETPPPGRPSRRPGPQNSDHEPSHASDGSYRGSRSGGGQELYDPDDFGQWQQDSTFDSGDAVASRRKGPSWREPIDELDELLTRPDPTRVHVKFTAAVATVLVAIVAVAGFALFGDNDGKKSTELASKPAVSSSQVDDTPALDLTTSDTADVVDGRGSVPTPRPIPADDPPPTGQAGNSADDNGTTIPADDSSEPESSVGPSGSTITVPPVTVEPDQQGSTGAAVAPNPDMTGADFERIARGFFEYVYWIQQNPDPNAVDAVFQRESPAWGHFKKDVEDLAARGVRSEARPAQVRQVEVVDLRSRDEVVIEVLTTYEGEQAVLKERLVAVRGDDDRWRITDHVVSRA